MATERRPLAGHVFSTTHVDLATEGQIKRCVAALGAEFRAQLDDRTTFLVVGRRWTEKYNTAVSLNSVILLAPAALDSVFQQWQNGDNEVEDVARALRDRALAPFEGMLICTTRFLNRDVEALRHLVEGGQGSFRQQLTSNCTILVANEPTGKKYVGARNWRIPVVHLRWILDSLNARAALNPEKYTHDQAGLQVDVEELHNTLKRAGTPNVEPQVGATQQLGTTLNSVQRHMSEPNNRPDAGPGNEALKEYREVSGSRRPKRPDEWETFRNKRTKTGSAEPALATKSAPTVVSSTASSTALERSRRQGGLLEGLSFVFHGFSDREITILRRTVSSHGGTILPMQSSMASNYVVVNSTAPRPSSLTLRGRIITEWALERTLHHNKRLLDDFWGSALPQHPTTGFSNLQVGVSGYTGIELRHVQLLLKHMGATHTPLFTPERDLLVASRSDANKVAKAHEWGVPVVRTEWLWDCALSGRIRSIYSSDSFSGKSYPAPKSRASTETAEVPAETSTHPPLVSTSRASPSKRHSPAKRSLATRNSSLASGATNNEEVAEPSGTQTQVGYLDEAAEARARLLQALGE